MESKVGNYFLDKHGEVWRLIGYCEHPTVVFEQVKTGRQTDSLVKDSRNFEDYGFSELTIKYTRATQAASSEAAGMIMRAFRSVGLWKF